MEKKNNIRIKDSIDRKTILKALSIVKKGMVFDLGMEINRRVYGQNPDVFPYSLIFESTPEDLKRQLQDIEKDSKLSGSNEVIISSIHFSTHIDALCHIIYEDKVAGEFNSKDIRKKDGWKKLGAETIPPIVGRAVLLDIAKYKGVEKLEGSYKISLEDIKGYLKEKKMNIESGDIACIRTGMSKEFYNPDYLKEGPGVSKEGAEWLAQKGIYAIGIDYASIDALPWKDFNNCAHLQLLYKDRVYIIEALNLEELSKENISEFLIICSSPKFTGCSGSWIRPVALV